MQLVIYVLIWVLVTIVVSVILFYVLWINGYLLKNRKTSIFFVVSLRSQNRCKFKFKYCDGY